MKTILLLTIVALDLLCLAPPPAHADNGQFHGRIAYSTDGNHNDPDDWISSPVTLAILAEAGLKDRLVHFDYNCILPLTNPDWEKIHAESVLGAAERYGFDKSRFFDCRQRLDAAVADIAQAINDSAADNPLYFIIAGPMEVPCLGIQKSDPAKRQFVYCVSHSRWNDGFASQYKFTFTKRSIIEQSVRWVQIQDQNRRLSFGRYGQLAAPDEFKPYFWMRDSRDTSVRWLWERMLVSTRPDPSDAGMTYFLVTGDEACDPAKLRQLLEAHKLPAAVTVRPQVRLEAEDFRHLEDFMLEDRDRSASHRINVVLTGTNAVNRIRTRFEQPHTALDSRYDVEVRFMPGSSGDSRLALQVNGVPQGQSWRTEDTVQQWQSQSITDVPIRVGDEIGVEVQARSHERIKLDYVQLNDRQRVAGAPPNSARRTTDARSLAARTVDDPSALPRQIIVNPANRRWWMDEPIRLLQTNLRETDSTLDARRLVQQVAEFPANTLLFNMGGIVAHYPTRVAFHYASPHLPPDRDLFGDVLQTAHARGIRVIGRFDLSKTQKPVFDAHPEWFFKRTNGEPAIYNGLYSACINGGYYREHALKILSEALERYEVDGLFFNMFGNPASDYSGRPMGPCQCEACQARFQARYHRPLPAHSGDPNYGEFLAESAREVAAMFADLIHRLRPGAAFLTYIQDHTDGIMSESNTAVGRALPLWPYSASDNVNRARSSEPDKMAFNLCMSFVDYPWRFVTVPPAEIQLRLHQSLAHGGALALNMHGTLDQEDQQALLAGRPIFQWHARHENLYVDQQNAARVLLLRGDTPAYRGFFRLLSEQHIPFAVSDNLKWLTDPSRKYDLVITPSTAPAEVEDYLRSGGRLLLAGAHPPALPVGKVIGRRESTQGSWRIHDYSLLPSLAPTKLLFLDGPFVELAPLEKPLLTLIPPAMFGPPEKVWVDKVETTIPGLVFTNHGAGRIGYIPWDVGGLYYRHSSPGHGGLMADVIDHLLPEGRQLRTSAHPLVEITVMQQPSRQRLLVHFVNLSGHADTAYFAPIPMRDIRVELAGPFRRATALRLDQELPVTPVGPQGRFTLPRLEAYEVVVLDE